VKNKKQGAVSRLFGKVCSFVKQTYVATCAVLATVFGIAKAFYATAAVAVALFVATSAFASTDPEDIITSASGKYNLAVAVFIAAAVIGAAIMFIRKGLRGRM